MALDACAHDTSGEGRVSASHGTLGSRRGALTLTPGMMPPMPPGFKPRDAPDTCTSATGGCVKAVRAARTVGKHTQAPVRRRSPFSTAFSPTSKSFDKDSIAAASMAAHTPNDCVGSDARGWKCAPSGTSLGWPG